MCRLIALQFCSADEGWVIDINIAVWDLCFIFFNGNNSKDNENDDNDNVMTTTVKTEVFHAYSGEIVDMIVKWSLFPMYLITRCI